MPPLRAGIVVFEKSPYWGPELKRQFSDSTVALCECRSLDDVWPATADWDVAVAVLCLDAAPAECLAWMAEGRAAEFPIVIVASAELASLEWRLREAGAVGFVNDELARDQVADLPPVPAARAMAWM